MTIKNRVNKLESVYGTSRRPFIVAIQKYGEDEDRAITRSLETNGLRREEVDQVIVIRRFAKA